MKSLEADNALVKKHKRELLGVRVVKSAPDKWWELSARQQLQISHTDWSNMSLFDRAEKIAFIQLRNMEETLRMDKQIIQRNIEQANRELVERRGNKGRSRNKGT